MQHIMAAGGIIVKDDFSSHKFLKSHEEIVLDAEFERSLIIMILAVSIQFLTYEQIYKFRLYPIVPLAYLL